MQAKPSLPSTALGRNSQTFSDHNYETEISSTGLISDLPVHKEVTKQQKDSRLHWGKLSLDFLMTSSGQVSNRRQERSPALSNAPRWAPILYIWPQTWLTRKIPEIPITNGIPITQPLAAHPTAAAR